MRDRTELRRARAGLGRGKLQPLLAARAAPAAERRQESRRDGSLITVKALLDPRTFGPHALSEPLIRAGFAHGRTTPAALRLALISVPFTQPMNLSADLLIQAHVFVERMQVLYGRLKQAHAEREPAPALIAEVKGAAAQLDRALDDNLDMHAALAAVQRAVTAASRRELSRAEAQVVRLFLEGADAVLDILPGTAESGFLQHFDLKSHGQAEAELRAGPLDAAQIAQLIAARHVARRSGDYARADHLRQGLLERGVTLEDSPQGVRWRRG